MRGGKESVPGAGVPSDLGRRARVHCVPGLGDPGAPRAAPGPDPTSGDPGPAFPLEMPARSARSPKPSRLPHANMIQGALPSARLGQVHPGLGTLPGPHDGGGRR